jgi:type IV pilus assembly protein PilN
MLRTNLSTRPFYNERAVQIALATGALVIVALTAFNVVEFRSLSARHTQLVGRVGEAERRAATLRTDADRARRSVDRAELERVASAAREANALIDQRTFSWTGLLNQLEATLPPDVRIQSIQPAADKDGNLRVGMVVLGKRAEDIEQFIEQLEGTKTFRHVLSLSESANAQGLLEVSLEGWYVPWTAGPGTAPARAGRLPAGTPRPGRED